nr:unnamed protein product [Digitaria exilis]
MTVVSFDGSVVLGPPELYTTMHAVSVSTGAHTSGGTRLVSPLATHSSDSTSASFGSGTMTLAPSWRSSSDLSAWYATSTRIVNGDPESINVPAHCPGATCRRSNAAAGTSSFTCPTEIPVRGKK